MFIESEIVFHTKDKCCNAMIEIGPTIIAMGRTNPIKIPYLRKSTFLLESIRNSMNFKIFVCVHCHS